LFDVGKRPPPLFVLKPLLRNWVLLDWDRQVTTLRQQDSGTLGYWGLQPRLMIEIGRRWYGMPHRHNVLIYLGGGIRHDRARVDQSSLGPECQSLFRPRLYDV
jgi:hypothetical protein